MKKINFQYLGRSAYAKTNELMLDLRAKRQQNLIPDTILFLEHEAVITTGRQKSVGDLKITLENLRKRGVDFVNSDRGGKLTFHGPGQLVVYFIMDIASRNLSVDQLVQKSLSAVQLFLKEEGIDSKYDCEYPGLWVGNQKIASVGFHIQKGVTTHGLSFNVSNDLGIYDCFIPCGIPDKGVTNLETLTHKKYEMNDVIKRLEKLIPSRLNVSCGVAK